LLCLWGLLLLCLQGLLLLHYGERESQKTLLERLMRKGVYTAGLYTRMLRLLLVAQVVLSMCKMSGAVHFRVGKTRVQVRKVQVPLGSPVCAG
jgi:hypothetical protein